MTMDDLTELTTPDWPAILRAAQAQVQARIHTSLPGKVRSYDVATQTAEVELVVQLDGAAVPPLADVPVLWPGGAGGFLHVPLAAGDTVMVLFAEEDFAKWWDTGSVSAPATLARHGLHAVVIPGLRRAADPLSVTGGHVTVGATTYVALGSDLATDPVALKSLVEDALADLLNGIISAAGSITAPGGGPAFVAALTAFQTTYLLALQTGATKVKAV